MSCLCASRAPVNPHVRHVFDLLSTEYGSSPIPQIARKHTGLSQCVFQTRQAFCENAARVQESLAPELQDAATSESHLNMFTVCAAHKSIVMHGQVRAVCSVPAHRQRRDTVSDAKGCGSRTHTQHQHTKCRRFSRVTVRPFSVLELKGYFHRPFSVTAVFVEQSYRFHVETETNIRVPLTIARVALRGGQCAFEHIPGEQLLMINKSQFIGSRLLRRQWRRSLYLVFQIRVAADARCQ